MWGVFSHKTLLGAPWFCFTFSVSICSATLGGVSSSANQSDLHRWYLATTCTATLPDKWHLLFEKRKEIFRFLGDSSERSGFQLDCDDIQMGWRVAQFRLDVDEYVRQLRLLRPGWIANKFQRRVDRLLLHSGVALCIPMDCLIKEFRGWVTPEAHVRMELGSHITLQSLMLEPGSDVTLQRSFSNFLCSAIFPLFMWLWLGEPRKLFLGHLFAPLGDICTVKLDDIRPVWERRNELLSADLPASSTHPSSVAICLSGLARTFSKPQVHYSFRKHVVDSLNASLLKIFYTLNLTSVNSTFAEQPVSQVLTLSDLMPALSVVGLEYLAYVTLEPPCCRPQLRHGLAPEDCALLWCHAQWRAKRICANNIRTYEQAFQVSFDWVLDTRPDLVWHLPLGDVRTFEHGRFYAIYARWWGIPGDHLFFLPRNMLDVYASAFHVPEEPGRFTCILKSEVEVMCPSSSSYPDCGCMLRHHLERQMFEFRMCTWQFGNESPSCPYRKLPDAMRSVLRMAT